MTPMADFLHIRDSFIEKMSASAQADGMPRIPGRVFALMLFEGGMKSFSELAETLQVSRGSISAAVRLLEERGMICRSNIPGQRGDFFELPQDPYTGLLSGVIRRAEDAQVDILDTLQQLNSAGPEGAQERLQTLARFYAALQESALSAACRLTGDEKND